jgi:DNA-binding transcriptional LysR family regulator
MDAPTAPARAAAPMRAVGLIPRAARAPAGGRAGLPDPAITTVDSLTAQKRLIEAGFGVALMPVANIREELRLGSLRTIDVDGLDARIPVVAVRRAGGYQSRAVTEFLALSTGRPPSSGWCSPPSGKLSASD